MTRLEKKKTYLATMWIIGGYGGAQVLRLGSNLILTRLLAPELFGVMAIANVFILGLSLFSDIGLGPGIIRSKRSDDPVFLNTAWTLQVIRGVVLWLITFAIAIPVGKIYESQVLAQIIPLIGLSTLFAGFKSTAVETLNKEILLGQITALQLLSQISGLLSMILIAYIYKSIWALAIGAVVPTVVFAFGSHFLESSNKNRFHLEKEAFRELISFGKWVFISTSMMFLATQSDRLLLGKMLPLTLLGVYNIALIFAELPKQVLLQISGKLVFPLLAKISDLPRPQFREQVLKQRKKVLLPLVILVVFFASFGDYVIGMLYDQRYHQAGWMLSLLSIGMWPFILNVSIDRCFYAIDKPKIPAIGNLCKFIYMVTCVPLFFHFGGLEGAVLAVAMNDLPVYLVIAAGLKLEGLACFRQDIVFTLFLIAGVSLCQIIRLFLGMGLPYQVLLLNP